MSTQPDEPVVSRSRRPSFTGVFRAVLVVVALALIFQNSDEATVDFLFWSFTSPGWLWLLLLFLGGVLVGSTMPWLRRPRKE